MSGPIVIIVLIMLLHAINILIFLFLIWGLLFPESSLRIEAKIRKRVFKRPVLILTADSAGYIRYRNLKLLVWIGVIFTGLLILLYLVMNIS